MVSGNKKTTVPAPPTELRRQAEERLLTNTARRHPPYTQEEMQRLIHELEVHQIELEMQNAELRLSQEQYEVSRNKYIELYDFAPIGYFTFDEGGLIREVNLCGAKLLGIDRQRLINSPFLPLIADAQGREIFARHLNLVMRNQGIQQCKLDLKGKDGTVINCLLQSVTVATIARERGCILTSIVDHSLDSQLALELKLAHETLELIVIKRTSELTRANEQLLTEIEERKRAEASLMVAFEENKQLKERLQAENTYLQQEVDQRDNLSAIIGQNNGLAQVFARVEQVAPQNATVLILGETGTGKGVVARAIHARSTRNNRPMITVNCTALPANLIESELFGREKGAFTGAHTRQIGRFELADGGTIFLDEIGEMPMELQCKLLRVIQEGEFERLGNPRTIKVDLRIIAASNRNLEVEIQEGRFRADLFYRLNVFPITLPPLRQRKEDIPLFVNHFVAKFNKKIGKHIASVPPQAITALQEYHWPGNVRELESIIERAVISSPGATLQVLDRFGTGPERTEPSVPDIKCLDLVEHDHILRVLLQTNWRIEGENGAAILLGLNPSTLRARMRKHHLFRQA